MTLWKPKRKIEKARRNGRFLRIGMGGESKGAVFFFNKPNPGDILIVQEL